MTSYSQYINLWWAQSKTVSYNNNNKQDPKEGCHAVSQSGEPHIWLTRQPEPKNEIITVTQTHTYKSLYGHTYKI